MKPHSIKLFNYLYLFIALLAFILLLRSSWFVFDGLIVVLAWFHIRITTSILSHPDKPIEQRFYIMLYLIRFFFISLLILGAEKYFK